MLEGLFKDLGSRLAKENHLSDVTWAMAKNSEEFLNAFMEFFGFGLISETPLEIFREYPLADGSRPDFVIENGDKLFVIESKIYDRYYHIDQYGKAPVSERKKIVGFGLITNHKIDSSSKRRAEEYHFKITTWENLTKFLDKKITDKNFDSGSEACIKAYIQYIKEVCSIMDLQEIRLDTVVSLYHFNMLIKRIIEGFDRDGFECNLYNASRAFGEDWSGRYFSLKRKNGKVILYPFFGIIYREETPIICLAFERDWCKDFYSKYQKTSEEGNFYQIDVTNAEVRYEMSQNKFTEFNGSTLDEQERILDDFFNKVIDEVTPYL